MTPLLQLSLALIFIIVAAKAGGYLSLRLGQPAVLGELLVGLVLGPSVLDLLHLPVFSDDHLSEVVHAEMRGNDMNRYIEDLAAIKKIALDWNAGWESGNVEALLALYADDPILMPQSQPAIIGKEAIRLIYQSVLKDFIIKGIGEIVEVESSGNLGYFWSRYSLTATPKARGDPITSRGKSLFIVKRQGDNSWKIARLMDNSDEEP